MKYHIVSLAVLMLAGSIRAEDPTAQPSGLKLDLQIADGPFKPDWESLKQYKTPEWFRDAKFGIWAHWSAQCVPEQGDWYAQHVYMENQDHYKFHVSNYGHPSKVGFKDIDHLWRAEKWDPDKLMALYKRAGAQYFVSLANHHDNFDCYDSKYQPWNSVAVGPKQDIVGKWAKAARANGMHFGVSVHGARAWKWFEFAQGADKAGPMAGVPYDGKLTKADGKGQWWDGLDPQDLYAQNHKIGEKPDAAYCQKFYNRTKDLIDKYQPDLLYFDDTVLPMREDDERIGLSIAAHLYNSHLKWHNGRNDAVLNTKRLNEEQRQCLVLDIERGVSNSIEPLAWQTDTCIGHWHYNITLFKCHFYKRPYTVLQILVDVVSKNGNLLLNVPMKGDGTIDSDEAACIEGIAKWMEVNRACIFGTRPWKVYGEGYRNSRAGAGIFNGPGKVYSSEEFRFTTKGNTLYAIALGWPKSGKLLIRTLGKKQAGLKGEVTRVQLLGCPDQLAWKRTDAGLAVTLPAKKPCEEVWALKIDGLDLAASQPSALPFLVGADDSGAFTCYADDADLHGAKLLCENHSLTRWNDFNDYASWPLSNLKPGNYEVGAGLSSGHGGNEFVVEVGGQKISGVAPKVEKPGSVTSLKLGTIKIDSGGDATLAVRPGGDAKKWHSFNLRNITLSPVK